MVQKQQWKSALENDALWEYVYSIGMISIENANLEMALADLLAVSLTLHKETAHAVFFTPKGAIARIEILENAARSECKRAATKYPSEDHQKIIDNTLKQFENITARSKAVVGKRHQVIHDAWGLHLETGQVARRSYSGKKGINEENTTLIPLTDIIRDMRLLIDEIIEFSRKLSDGLDPITVPSQALL